MAEQEVGAPACAECARLKVELALALRSGDHSGAVDHRVLLRRHPCHDDVPASTFQLCGATRPEECNNPRPCVRTEHRDGDHVDWQGVAWPAPEFPRPGPVD
ncbi:hypothetical protein ACFY12_15070 [Streptomyces sp. NPDC001339]|uniref:hypothetical protein n=1 Tax=Streptomyces sp. NPDC001339 TaxID=3364563 RepID=UPI0036BDCDA9